ncbi:MAG TPA: transketolase C-terminal domain-containing protein [Polyangiaceae bacterium]|nr:transketolase C-terminal domain-containing protein [Polyangiaceae bacterium]
MRVEFVRAVTSVLAEDQSAMFITGDLGYNALEQLSSTLGRRFLNAGVAEQNMMGVAAGAALTGLKPWVYSIAPFATYRCVEQIRNDICLHALPVRIAGNGGGFTYGIMGSTHHALEDLAVLKSLPNMQLFFPCANDHVAAAVAKMAELSGPSYIRLSISAFGTDRAALHEHPETLTRRYFARPAPRKGGITVVGAGHGVQVALHALSHLGLDQENVDVFGLARYPFDFAKDTELLASVAETRKVIFIEEHYRSGGMGESFAASGVSFDSFRIMCAAYTPGQRYGSARFHMNQCNLTPEALMAAVRGDR